MHFGVCVTRKQVVPTFSSPDRGRSFFCSTSWKFSEQTTCCVKKKKKTWFRRKKFVSQQAPSVLCCMLLCIAGACGPTTHRFTDTICTPVSTRSFFFVFFYPWSIAVLPAGDNWILWPSWSGSDIWKDAELPESYCVDGLYWVRPAGGRTKTRKQDVFFLCFFFFFLFSFW